jgi:hypothetical protein
MFEAFEHLNFGFVSDLDIRISNLLTPLKRLASRAYEVRISRAGGLMRLIKVSPRGNGGPESVKDGWVSWTA